MFSLPSECHLFWIEDHGFQTGILTSPGSWCQCLQIWNVPCFLSSIFQVFKNSLMKWLNARNRTPLCCSVTLNWCLIQAIRSNFKRNTKKHPFVCHNRLLLKYFPEKQRGVHFLTSVIKSVAHKANGCTKDIWHARLRKVVHEAKYEEQEEIWGESCSPAVNYMINLLEGQAPNTKSQPQKSFNSVVNSREQVILLLFRKHGHISSMA